MFGNFIWLSVPQILRNAFHGASYQEDRLARLKERFAAIPEGKTLLALAEKMDYQIGIVRHGGTAMGRSQYLC